MSGVVCKNVFTQFNTVLYLKHGFFKVLVLKHLKIRTLRGPGPMSGPYPARYGPDPENISPVRVRVPLTLEGARDFQGYQGQRPTKFSKAENVANCNTVKKKLEILSLFNFSFSTTH